MNTTKQTRNLLAFLFGVGLAITIFPFLIFNDTVFAAEATIACQKFQYPWCNLQGEEKSPAGIVRKFYVIALGLAGAAALGVLAYGGILWTVSGAVGDKKNALDYIKGALWGVVLLLGAYLILNTINPQLVDLINPGLDQAPPPPAMTRYDSGEERNAREGIREGGGPSLVPISVPTRGVRVCAGSASGRICQVESNLNNRLRQFNASYASGGGANNVWWITEAYPPTRSHQNPCHLQATCVDANFIGGRANNPSVSDINTFIERARAANLRAVYEVSRTADRDRLIGEGVPESNIQYIPPRPDGAPGITAPHFSIYKL